MTVVMIVAKGLRGMLESKFIAQEIDFSHSRNDINFD